MASKSFKLNIKIFSFFVFYVFFVGFLLQKYIIPSTSWHAGNGLLASGDWLLFQQLAVEHVAQIKSGGWSIFDWRPGGQGPSGFAAAIYALTGIYEPWVLLPIHGVVYAFAALGLFEVIKDLSGNIKIGLMALIPLLLMPSLAMVWGQIHKDIWVISAVLLMMAYWTKLFLSKPFAWWIGVLVLIYVNACMVWMRPYTLQIALVGQTLLLVMLLGVKIKQKNYFVIFLGVLSIIVTLYSWNITKVANATVATTTTVAASATSVVNATATTCKVWNYTLPIKQLDNTLMSLACTRDGFNIYFPNARSNIDSNVEFNSFFDILFYTPRALQISVFSPFPDMWLARGTTEASSLFRLVAAIETLVMYIALLGIFLVQIHNTFNKEKFFCGENIGILAIILFGLIWVVVYVLTTGNVGSIYRMRFPIMLLWMGLGLLSWRKIFVWYQSRIPNAHL